MSTLFLQSMELAYPFLMVLMIQLPLFLDFVVLKIVLRKFQIPTKQIIKALIATLLIWYLIASLFSLDLTFSYFALFKGSTPMDMTMLKLLLYTPFMNFIPAFVEAHVLRRLSEDAQKYSIRQLLPRTLFSRVISAYIWLGAFMALARL